MLRILFVASLLAVPAGPALAQSTSSASATSGANSSAVNNAGATAGAISAGGTVSIVNGVPGDSTLRYKGAYTVNNTPDVYAPGLTAGLNTCAGSYSAGVAVAGFGLTGGGTTVDQGCERRNMATLLRQMGEGDAAREVLCEDDVVRGAFARVGRPCITDRVQVSAAVAQPATMALPPAPPPVVAMQPIVSRGDPGYGQQHGNSGAAVTGCTSRRAREPDMALAPLGSCREGP
ncbi:hypothetical protein [Inquilinus sp. OTU3971]|uniref:hypothetical protein n=1 Tax=Inquilinus sp. OTU3971 TaxID=3043855 RepID=UPI00313EC440